MIFSMAYQPFITYGPQFVSDSSYTVIEPNDCIDIVLYVPNFWQSQATATSLTWRYLKDDSCPNHQLSLWVDASLLNLINESISNEIKIMNYITNSVIMY